MSEENPLSVFESVNVVSLRPGDVLLFKYPKRLPDDARASAREVLSATFPNHDFIILDGGQDISVLRPEPGWFGRMFARAKGGAGWLMTSTSRGWRN